jgi:Domain of unknown function (DUF397)
MKFWFTTSKANSLTWIKASKSAGVSACVELASDGELIALRDSKNPSIALRYTHLEMDAFIDGAKRGEFDHLLCRLE